MADTTYLDYVNIDKFIHSTYIAEGLPFTNRFVCQLLLGGSSKSTEDLFWQVISVDTPGFTLTSNDMELFGERRFNFTKREDTDLGITFLETADLSLRMYFDEWMKEAVNVSGRNGTIIRNYPDVASRGSVLKIFPINHVGKAVMCDVFNNIVPYDISGMTYNYSDMEVIKTTVKFKFKYHTLATVN